MDARSPMLRSACSGPRGGEARPLRRRKSGSETPKLQSMSYGDAQTLRSVFPAPLRDARLPLQRSQLLRVPVRHGLKFWSLRPHVSTARCSQFLPPWRGTCRTQHQRSLDHRALRGPTTRNAKVSAPWLPFAFRAACAMDVSSTTADDGQDGLLWARPRANPVPRAPGTRPARRRGRACQP